MQRNALGLEGLMGERGDFLVFNGKHPVQHFHHRNLGAQGTIEAGEFDTDGPRSHHQQGLGHGLGHHGVAIGPDQLAVGLKAGKSPRPRPSGENNMLSR